DTIGVWQAWIGRLGGDPEARSAADIARTRLAAGALLSYLRRARLIEIAGSALDRDGATALMHASTLVYNPYKEHCHVRRESRDAVPGAEPGTRLLLVMERSRTRRPASERWWAREAGQRVVVRRGVVG